MSQDCVLLASSPLPPPTTRLLNEKYIIKACRYSRDPPHTQPQGLQTTISFLSATRGHRNLDLFGPQWGSQGRRAGWLPPVAGGRYCQASRLSGDGRPDVLHAAVTKYGRNCVHLPQRCYSGDGSRSYMLFQLQADLHMQTCT